MLEVEGEVPLLAGEESSPQSLHVLKPCDCCKRVAPVVCTFRSFNGTSMYCTDCGSDKIPAATRCVVCGNPAAARTYITVKFNNFPKMPVVYTPVCSSACRLKELARDPPAESGKETLSQCLVCFSLIEEKSKVECKHCELLWCSDICKQRDAAEHKKVCPPVVDLPCELAFSAGGKYALFPVPLAFPSEYVANFYKDCSPAPPPGVAWTTIFRRDPAKEIEFQDLLDIAKGVKTHGKKFEIFLKCDGGWQRPYRRIDYYGTREIAEKWAERCFTGREWEVRPVPAQ